VHKAKLRINESERLQ